jgi:periplasmic protein TonB
MSPPEIPIRANSAERLLQPEAAPPEKNRYRALVGACLIYAILLAPALLDGFLWRPAPPIEEIPVEVVVEPPPQEKPPEPPQPPPQPDKPSPTKPYDEAPAHEAPRAANNEKLDTDGPDKPAKAPTAEPNDSPSPNPDKDKAPSAANKSAPEPEQKSPDPTAAKLAETTANGELNSADPAENEKQMESEAKPDQTSPANGNSLPLFASVPGLDFGALAKKTPIATGQAKVTYLSIVYGMVMAQMRYRHPGADRLVGTIDFTLDSIGNVIRRSVSESSGSRAFDNAALEAVARASPFPRPPDGAPIALQFTYTTD